MTKIFFEHVPQIGTLRIEHVFYFYGEPILFVCLDDFIGSKYLCSCCKLGEEWLITKVTNEVLVQMIDNEIALDAIFKRQEGGTFFLSWDGYNLHTSYDLEDNMFPEPGALLDMLDEDTLAYRDSLYPSYMFYYTERFDTDLLVDYMQKSQELSSTFRDMTLRVDSPAMIPVTSLMTPEMPEVYQNMFKQAAYQQKTQEIFSLFKNMTLHIERIYTSPLMSSIFTRAPMTYQSAFVQDMPQDIKSFKEEDSTKVSINAAGASLIAA